MPDNTLPLWSDAPERATVPIVTVVARAPIDKLYAYAVPPALEGRVIPGQRVIVPFGRGGRRGEAFVISLGEQVWDNTLREIIAVSEPDSWLDDPLLRLGRWIAEYYAAPLGQVLSAMVPAAVRRQSGFETRRFLGLTEPAEQIRSARPRLGAHQRRLLEHLPYPGEVAATPLLEELAISTATVRRAVQQGWIRERVERVPRAAPDFDLPLVEPQFELNAEQQRACRTLAAALDARRFQVLLLYGVSGSGKTEVYIDAMRRTVAAGRQVIVLVPEIALTTQLVQRFASRFKDVAVLHSGLTDVQRSLCWHAIRDGTKRVIIGTRSSLFAPCRDLGLIVVDEEQDGSYKNQQNPRFHARDAAIERGRLAQVPVLLGSATPALETFRRCQTSADHHIVELPRRVAGLPMPQVELVDLREEVGARPGMHLLSRRLDACIGEALSRSEQVVLFLNQRGYAAALFCPRCRERLLCPNCQASLVVHRDAAVARCHHCSQRRRVPEWCPDSSCGGRLLQFGVGTERVEEELARKFPMAHVQRVDSDTMVHGRDYERLIDDFAAGRTDILIGTQIVAKGLDFPRVSLVGVISADTALHRPDFRANERTFQLVTQVAGRAGRAQARGRVIVQTVMSDLPALQAAVQHDYAAFAARELQVRADTGMPPYGFLARWLLQDRLESKLKRAAEALAGQFRHSVALRKHPAIEVLGPAPSPIERLRGLYRYDVLMRFPDIAARQALLREYRDHPTWRPRVDRLLIDVDPLTLV